MKSVISLAAVLTAALSSVALAAPPPHANNPGGDHGPPSGEGGGRPDHGDDDHFDEAVALVLAGIAAGEARELADVYGARGGKPLPPGIRKNLARGKPIPPGIAMQSIPGDMRARLPHYDGYEWRRYGTDLVLVSIASAVIADVLIDVFD